MAYNRNTGKIAMTDPLLQAATLLRVKAQQLLRLAEGIEAEAKQGRQPHSGRSSASIDPGSIKAIMGDRAMRRNTIAAELGTDEKSLEPILTEQNGFVRNERGWYRCINDSLLSRRS